MNYDTKLNELDELDIEYHGETMFGDYTIKVERDDDAESPREWDNLGTMYCWHRGYNLGDYRENSYDNPSAMIHDLSGLFEDELTEYLTEEDLEKCWDAAIKNHIIMPLYLYDHSGITMNTTGFTCDWDSGQVGYIVMSYEKIRKEYNWKNITKKRRAQIEKYLTGEVETYDHYLTGSVYWYSIEKGEDEEHVDSCGGYYGYYTDDDGYMISCIKDAIKWDIEHTPQQIDLPLPQPTQTEMRV